MGKWRRQPNSLIIAYIVMHKMWRKYHFYEFQFLIIILFKQWQIDSKILVQSQIDFTQIILSCVLTQIHRHHNITATHQIKSSLNQGSRRKKVPISDPTEGKTFIMLSFLCMWFHLGTLHRTFMWSVVQRITCQLS